MEKSRTFFSATTTYFLIFVLFILIRILTSFNLGLANKGGEFLFTIIIQVVLLLGGSLILFPALRKTKRSTVAREFGIKKPSWKVVVFSILLGCAVFFLNGFISDFFNSFIELLGYEHNYGSSVTSYSFGSLIVNLIFTAMLPAICEEVAHRGMLLRSFTPMGTWKAIFLSSLLFGMLHLNIEQFFYATILGIFMGALTIYTNSIIPAMIVHFMNNALSTYRTFSIVNGLPFGKIVVWFNTIMSSNIFIGMLLSILLIIVLVYLIMKLSSMIIRVRMKEDLQLVQTWFNRQIMREEYLLGLENANFDVTERLSKNSERRFKDMMGSGDEDFRPSPYSKVLLYATLFMGGVLTICTFVWGVL